MQYPTGDYHSLLGSSSCEFDRGRSWATSLLRPHPSEERTKILNQLVQEWIDKRSLPLLVRKSKNRGSVVCGTRGREFVPVDNSPAQWLYAMACDNREIHFTELDFLLKEGKIPVAMILSKEEKRGAIYSGLLHHDRCTQSFGWKLAHIDQIGKGLSKINIAECEETFLEEHFKKLMSPSNMFVIPKDYSQLAEDRNFLQGFIRGMNGK